MGLLSKSKGDLPPLTALNSWRLCARIQKESLDSILGLTTNYRRIVKNDTQIGADSIPSTFPSAQSPRAGCALNQQEVDDGAYRRKYDKGKAPILQGLFQYFPLALTAIAKISQYGLEKYNLVYSDVNWAKVENGIARYSDAFGRHILGEHSDPNGMDPESGFHHALQALWNDCARVELMLRQKVITMERYNKKNNDDSSGPQQT